MNAELSYFNKSSQISLQIFFETWSLCKTTIWIEIEKPFSQIQQFSCQMLNQISCNEE